MSPWIENHFGVQRPEVKRRRSARFWFLLVLIFVLLPAAAAGAWWLGYLDPVIKEAKQAVLGPGPRTLSQARANELQRLISSRESGLDLMGRDRTKAAAKHAQAESVLTAAKARLSQLEHSRPHSGSTSSVYEWNLAYNDALSAAKNATSALATQKKLLASFDSRIAKATQERDDAKAELDGAVITP